MGYACSRLLKNRGTELFLDRRADGSETGLCTKAARSLIPRGFDRYYFCVGCTNSSLHDCPPEHANVLKGGMLMWKEKACVHVGEA